jgi:hypothetical protein
MRLPPPTVHHPLANGRRGGRGDPFDGREDAKGMARAKDRLDHRKPISSTRFKRSTSRFHRKLSAMSRNPAESSCIS